MGTVELDTQYPKLVPDHQNLYNEGNYSNNASLIKLVLGGGWWSFKPLYITNDSHVWVLISRLQLILSFPRKGETFRS